MKTAKYLLFCCAATVVSLTATAQTAGDLLRFSQYNYSLGTARSAALGGAFTSLGADLASMSINPAGLGMYRGSDVGVSFSVSSANLESQYLGRKHSFSKTKFVPANIGAALNMYQGDGPLTSFTLGVSYNKLADFNTTSLASGSGASNSITEFFAEQLNGIPESALQSTSSDPYIPFRNHSIGTWGGILGYQTGIMNPLSNKTQYSPWDVLSQEATINPSLRNFSQGSIGEYAISGGFNFQNLLYMGFTVGIQDIYYSNENNYFEYYQNNSATLRNMNYIQSMKMNGTGVNFKFGLVLRPIDNLRIGVAIHTPTFIGINEEYVEYMSADYTSTGAGRLLDSPYALNDYDIQTPTRFLTGISYTLPGIGLITADYERVWYSGMRLKNMSGGNWNYEEAIKEDVQNLFKATNNFRVGLEVLPFENFYLRAGYAYYGECMIQNPIFTNQTNINSYQNYSAGLGFRFKHIYTDLTYVYTNYNYADYDIFYYDETLSSGIVTPTAVRNTVTLSLGVKF